jgi:hypothetical protein
MKKKSGCSCGHAVVAAAQKVFKAKRKPRKVKRPRKPRKKAVKRKTKK